MIILMSGIMTNLLFSGHFELPKPYLSLHAHAIPVANRDLGNDFTLKRKPTYSMCEALYSVTKQKLTEHRNTMVDADI